MHPIRPPSNNVDDDDVITGGASLDGGDRVADDVLEIDDELEVRRPNDAGTPRTYWFQGRVVSRIGDQLSVRLQVLDASLPQQEPWVVPTNSERIAARYEHIKREVWQTLT